MIDQRLEVSKAFRAESQGFGAAPVYHFGDTNFKPSPAAVLADEMSIQLPAKVKGPVILTSLDMTLYQPKTQASAAESTPGIGPGGMLLGKLMFGESYGGSFKQEDITTCSFEVDIAGKHYSVIHQTSARPIRWNECIRGAVYELTQQVK